MFLLLYWDSTPAASDADVYDTFRNEFLLPPEDGVDLEKIDIAALAAENPDFQGWLQIPGTPISYPVVLGDDNDFYLYHDFTKEPSVLGCLFFDTRSTVGARNRVIYGHNMGQGKEAMFSSLVEYENREYVKEHSLIYFTDREGNTCKYAVSAVINFDTSRISEFDFRRPLSENEDDYAEFVRFFRENSIFNMPAQPNSTESLILCTCNRAYGASNRMLIFCEKIR